MVHVGSTFSPRSICFAQLDHQTILGGLKVYSIEEFVGHRGIVGPFDVPNMVDFVAGQVFGQKLLQMLADGLVHLPVPFREV